MPVLKLFIACECIKTLNCMRVYQDSLVHGSVSRLCIALEASQWECIIEASIQAWPFLSLRRRKQKVDMAKKEPALYMKVDLAKALQGRVGKGTC